ncbi:hypothetical protein GCM10010977_24070 [Citricoccus zhacaiensis]|uniref:Hydantoin racemase n=1 Tax=Citricoccus zhacaiensis TaxID=489142 RepID=A0ABQ2M5X8_9MICC|nr:aspartate/glutamate racemase family protein [Citricoccus zhacaiensis]GGO47258.1 hypothetical protein GCM10010977_24070 [Citricoccus zhacaiensis]
MKLLAITPIAVSSEELSRRQARYDRLCPPGVTIRLEALGAGSDIPRALDTPEDIEASEQALLHRFRNADPTGVDAFLPDCVLDPTVDVADAGLSRPVLGLLKLAGHFLAGQGLSVGALARNEAIASELDRKYASYGLAPIVGGTRVLGLAVGDIADDETWQSAVERRLRDTDADVAINGCSAVEVSPSGRRPVVVDPTAMALQLLGLNQRVMGDILPVSADLSHG